MIRLVDSESARWNNPHAGMRPYTPHSALPEPVEGQAAMTRPRCKHKASVITKTHVAALLREPVRFAGLVLSCGLRFVVRQAHHERRGLIAFQTLAIGGLQSSTMTKTAHPEPFEGRAAAKLMGFWRGFLSPTVVVRQAHHERGRWSVASVRSPFRSP